MGLDVWFRQDVARILASTQETLGRARDAVPALDAERASAYEQGFEDALRVVAVAFGLGVPRHTGLTDEVYHVRRIDERGGDGQGDGFGRLE